MTFWKCDPQVNPSCFEKWQKSLVHLILFLPASFPIFCFACKEQPFFCLIVFAAFLHSERLIENYGFLILFCFANGPSSPFHSKVLMTLCERGSRKRVRAVISLSIPQVASLPFSTWAETKHFKSG